MNRKKGMSEALQNAYAKERERDQWDASFCVGFGDNGSCQFGDRCCFSHDTENTSQKNRSTEQTGFPHVDMPKKQEEVVAKTEEEVVAKTEEEAKTEEVGKKTPKQDKQRKKNERKDRKWKALPDYQRKCQVDGCDNFTAFKSK